MARNMSNEVYSTSPDGSNFPRRGTSLHGENLTLPQVLPLDKLSMGDQTYHFHAELEKVTNALAGTVPENSSLDLLQGKPLSSLRVEELKRVRNCVFENSLKARERIDVLKEAIYKLDTYHKTMLPRERSQIDLPAPVLNKQVHTSIMDMQVEGRPNKNHATSPTKGKGSHASAKSFPIFSHTSPTFDSQQQTSNPNRGDLDDSEELLAAVNTCNNASDVVFSGPFSKQTEPSFASATSDDQDFLKHLVREVEDEDVILISPPGSNRTGEVSKNKCHLHKLEKADFKRQKVEDREREVLP